MEYLVWLSLFLLLGTTVVHYEALNVASRFVARPRVHPRLAVLLLVLGLVCAHGTEVGIYALAYFLERSHFGLTAAAGGIPQSFSSYLYFSAIAIATLLAIAALHVADMYKFQYLTQSCCPLS